MSDEQNTPTVTVPAAEYHALKNETLALYGRAESAERVAKALQGERDAESIARVVRAAAESAGARPEAIGDVITMLTPALRVEGGTVRVKGSPEQDLSAYVGSFLEARPYLRRELGPGSTGRPLGALGAQHHGDHERHPGARGPASVRHERRGVDHHGQARDLRARRDAPPVEGVAVIDALTAEDTRTAAALRETESHQEGCERAHAEAIQEVAEAESAFAAAESDATWRRVERARSIRDRAALSAAAAQRRTEAAREAHQEAHQALVRAQLGALRARLTPAAWLERMAPGLRELARLQREQLRVLDSLRVALGERLGLEQQAHRLARKLGREGLEPDAYVTPASFRASVLSAAAYVLRTATRQGLPDALRGLVSPEDLLAALGREEWSRDREDYFKVLAAIAAPEFGMDIGPGPDVEVQDLSPGTPEAA